MQKLRITEIFYSLQGEAKTVGIPTVFVRLTGCPLRCQYCDTEYAFKGGQLLSFDEIIAEIQKYNTKYIVITGGEPLAQPQSLELMRQLCDMSYNVSLETSGALDVSQVDSRVIKVLDIKTPGSAEVTKNYYGNFQHLSADDQIKFVICDRNDFDWAKQLMQEYELNTRCEVLFSPSYQELDHRLLADWILEDQLPVRYQIQLHKHIWGDEPGR